MAASDVERSISTILLKNSRLWTVYSSLGTAAPSPHGRVVCGGGGEGDCTQATKFVLNEKPLYCTGMVLT